MTRDFEHSPGLLTYSRQPRARKRIVAFASILGTLATIFCFARLSEGSLISDEAAFACTTERMKVTGKAGSHLWYTFYAFPLLAVMLAGFFLDAGPRLLQSIGMRFQTACIAGACLAAAFIGVDLIKIGLAIDKPSWLFPPIALYDRYSAQLEQGQCRFVLFDFPHASGKSATGRSGANYEDLYYGPKMRGAIRIDHVEELQRLLSEPTPTLVLLPSLQWPTSQSFDRLRPELVVQSNPIHSYTYPLLSFHGASAKVSIAELIKLSRSNQP